MLCGCGAAMQTVQQQRFEARVSVDVLLVVALGMTLCTLATCVRFVWPRRAHLLLYIYVIISSAWPRAVVAHTQRGTHISVREIICINWKSLGKRSGVQAVRSVCVRRHPDARTALKTHGHGQAVNRTT